MDIVFDPLGTFLGWVGSFLSFIGCAVLSIFPDGDPEVFGFIDSVGSFGADLEFNVFYFLDLGIVSVCFWVLVAMICVTHLLKITFMSVGVASKAIEAVPVIE